MCGFYKINNAILSFDYDSLEVKFNHFIMKRENLQRLSNELERGQFKLSYPIIEKEFDINRSKAQRLVKSFIELGIIEPILISKVRGKSSIYGYISAYENSENVGRSTDKQNDKQNDKQKASDCNDLKQSNDKQNDKQNDKSKKEYKKELLKSNIYSAFTSIFELWNSKEIIVHRSIGDKMVKAYQKALKEYSHDEIVEAIENYKKILDSDFYYSHKFSLENFLKQGNAISRFVKDGDVYVNYLENKKAPTGIGGIKNNKSNSSICNSYINNTPKVEGTKFI